eukprot:tig00000411_g519.t1
MRPASLYPHKEKPRLVPAGCGWTKTGAPHAGAAFIVPAAAARRGAQTHEATKGPAAAAAAAAAAAGKARPFHASFEGQHVAYLLHNGRTWYTGETANLTRRYKEHTRGTIRGSYTKGKGPWRLVAVAAPFSNRSVAQGFETTLKGKSGGQAKRLEAMRKLATEYSAPGAPIASLRSASRRRASSSAFSESAVASAAVRRTSLSRAEASQTAPSHDQRIIPPGHIGGGCDSYPCAAG